VQAGFSVEDSLALKAIAQLAPPVAVFNSNQKKPKSLSSKVVNVGQSRQAHGKSGHDWNNVDVNPLPRYSSEGGCEERLRVSDIVIRSSAESSSASTSSRGVSRKIAQNRMSRGTSLDDVSTVSSNWVEEVDGYWSRRPQAATAALNGRRVPAGRWSEKPLSASSSNCVESLEATMAGKPASLSDSTLQGSRLSHMPVTPAAEFTSRPVVAMLSPCAVHFKGTASSPEPVAANVGPPDGPATNSPVLSRTSPNAVGKMPAMVALPHGAPRPSPRLLRAGRSPLTNTNSASRLSAVFDWEP